MQHLTPVDRSESGSLGNFANDHPGSSSNSSNNTLNGYVATLLSALTSNYSNQRINNSKHLILQFLTEIVRRSKSSHHVVIHATYLFHQLYTNGLKRVSMTGMPEFARCSKRVFLSCLILAHKFNNDSTFSMKTWGLISGLKVRDLATMERWALSIFDYKLYVSASVLAKWYTEVLSESFEQTQHQQHHQQPCSRKRPLDHHHTGDADESHLDTPHKLRKQAHIEIR